MVKRLLKISGLLVGLLMITASIVRAEGPMKIGVMDAKRCIEQSEAGKKIYALLKEKIARIQRDLEVRQNDLKKLQEQYTTKSGAYSIEVKREKEKELMRKEEDYRDQAREKEAEFQKEEARAFEKLTGEIFEVAAAIGKEEGYSLILEAKSGVVYFIPTLDLTDKVIKRVNEKKTKTH